MNVFVVSIPNESERKKYAHSRSCLRNDVIISQRLGLKTGVKMAFFGLK